GHSASGKMRHASGNRSALALTHTCNEIRYEGSMPTRLAQGREESPVMIPRTALPRRPLGRTGLQVSALGFGTAPLGDLYRRLDDSTAIAAVERAFALGINLLDTSPLY